MTMKRLMALVLSTLLLLTTAIGAASAEGLTPGTYTQTVAGRNGDLEVQVTFDDNGIADVKVTNHQETQGVADAALEKIPAQVVEYQSVQIDAVTGATITSNAILEAVIGCIEQAGGKLADFDKAVEKKAGEDIEITADVVIIGAGGAGLAAAASAGANGASVIVLEKGAADASFGYVQSLVNAFGAGIGFLVAMVLFAGVRERLELCDVPKFLKGLPITLIAASLVAVSFLGFNGIVDGLLS